MPDFCHLHCHTTYSLLDGAARIDKLVRKAKTLGMRGLAITDHGNMFGVPEFYTTARNAGLQPVIGCEFYLAPDGMEDKKSRRRNHQLLLARNETGYRNLVTLSSLSYSQGFYYKPRIDFETLARYSDGLIATTCCIQGQIPQAILNKGEDEARSLFEKYLDVFGEYFFVEVQPPVVDGQETVNETLVRWAAEYKVKVVATNDVHYVEEEDFRAQEILLCLQSNKRLSDPDRLTFGDGQLYLKSKGQMLKELGGETRAASWLDTTGEILDQCNVELKLDTLLMPHFPIPDSFEGSSDKYLRHLAFEGAKGRYKEISPEFEERLNMELGIISQMGYAGYFLIVQDFTTAARTMKVDVGPGRGSAAGSAVAYSLGITNIDPLAYGLLFERFLNPERVSMPDIDIDFDDVGRAKVIEYVVNKYGRNNVCQIVTYGTMGAKTAIRDVARVMEISLPATNRIAGYIPDTPNITLAEVLETSSELREEIKAGEALNEEYSSEDNLSRRDQDQFKIPELIKYAQVLEGGARHTGVHAAGVIIAPGPVSDYIPTAIARSKDDQVLITQYDGNWVERFGLLKMDFLGLTTLTILRESIRLVEETRGIKLDLDTIPLDDQKVFKLFQRGETAGIFQFESPGMRRSLTKLRPTTFDDLIAMNALYRPGPMDLIPDYIARKHGEKPVSFLHESLEPILKSTFGLPVYQEQVMQMAQVMADYSLGEADILRRAMGKKKAKVMAEQRAVFVNKAGQRGIEERTAENTFAMMEKFAGYGFNKCLTGDTRITHAATGRPFSLQDLHDHGPDGFLVHALDAAGRFTVRPVERVFYNGYQRVFTVVTGSGRSVTATATHKFLTSAGWQRLGALKPGDHLFTPTPEFYLNLECAHPAAVDTRLEGTRGACAILPGSTESEVARDAIVAIEPAGVQATFDLTVAENHNYLANGLVVHNSHSAAYSLVAYQTAYMKTHYAPEYMAAVLTSMSGDSKKFPGMLAETRRMGLEILLPSVNLSQSQFTVEGRKIRFGLASIKGLGRHTIETMLKTRASSGSAHTLFSLARSFSIKDLNRKTLESLVYSGALDELPGNRAQKFKAVDMAIRDATKQIKAEEAGQFSLFGEAGTTTLPEPKLPECPPEPKVDVIRKERDLIGAYVTGHPLDEWKVELAAVQPAKLESTDIPDGNGFQRPRRTFCGVVTEVNRRKTSQNVYRLEATIEDKSGQGMVRCFSESVRQVSTEKVYHQAFADDILCKGEVVRVSGEVSSNGGSVTVQVRDLRDIVPMSQIRRNITRLMISVSPTEKDVARIEQFAQECTFGAGPCELRFQIRYKEQWSVLRSKKCPAGQADELIEAATRSFGHKRLKVTINQPLRIMRPVVMFVCTHNSARSQMAEGLLRQLYGEYYETGSAGTHPSGVSQHAKTVMDELGIDIASHTSDSLDDFADPAPDYVFTLCDSAADSCPNAYAKRKVIHQSFEDPRATQGSEEDMLAAFRRVRDEIKAWITHEFDPKK